MGRVFELTLVAEFFGAPPLLSNVLDVIVTGDTGSLYFDETLDYNFADDAGFADG